MSESRRILILGLASSWGGRLALELEGDASIEMIVGLDERDPRHALQRTEFVRAPDEPELLRRLIAGAAIDTVVETRLAGSPAARRGLVAGAGAGGDGGLLTALGESPVRKLVIRSSDRVYGSEFGQPSFISEVDGGDGPPGSEVQAALLAAERTADRLARRRPELIVTVLRFAAAIGAEQHGDVLSLLALPVVPAILGFDPRWQFVHELDAIAALALAVRRPLPGIYNVAGDGVLVLSEIASLLGKRLLPLLPPWGTVLAAAQLRRLGLPVPVELLRELRHGRGLDNRRLKVAGLHYRYTSREAILELRTQQRLRPLLGSGGQGYRYQREVEEFLRRSPSVRRASDPSPSPAPASAGSTPYDLLGEGEVIELLPTLETEALELLHEHERRWRRRPRLLEALAGQLELRARIAADGGG